jgi:hypothetical protein
MTDRQKAIAKAREAYRFWNTTGIKPVGFTVTDDEQHPFRFVAHGWVIRLRDQGKVSFCYRATEPEDFQ